MKMLHLTNIADSYAFSKTVENSESEQEEIK